MVFIDFERGKYFVNLLETGVEVMMKISVGHVTTSPTTPANGQFTANNTSVLFVSISFIVLIIISLAWLVFYYIQRCRYTNAKERLSVSIVSIIAFNPSLAEHDMPCLSKQCRCPQLIWICTVCH